MTDQTSFDQMVQTVDGSPHHYPSPLLPEDTTIINMTQKTKEC